MTGLLGALHSAREHTQATPEADFAELLQHYVEDATSRSWPRTVSYYCRPQVARAILHRRELWLRDIFKMDDARELDYSLTHFVDQLKDAAGNRKSRAERLTSRLCHHASKPRAAWGNTFAFDNSLVFAICFSEHRDNVGLWREYGKSDSGDEAGGVEICFSVERLGAIALWSSARSDGPMFLAKVCYKSPRCQCARKLVHGLDLALDAAKSPVERAALERLFRLELLRQFVAHKHPSWRHQAEYRLVAMGPLPDARDRRVHFRAVTVRGTPSFVRKLNVPRSSRGNPDSAMEKLIPSITLGPFFDPALKDELRAEAAKIGLANRMRDSDAPLRR